MAGPRTAGYCSSCNRGVSIVRPEKSGLMNRMRSALSQADDDSNWVCTKCGKPATRGFAPAPTETTSASDNMMPTENRDDEVTETIVTPPESPTPVQTSPELAQPAPDPVQPAPDPVQPAPDPAQTAPAPAQATPAPAETINCPSCEESIPANSEECFFCKRPLALTKQREATCHLCNKPIPLSAETAKKQINCPTCNEGVILPGIDDDISALTSPPAVMKLDDNPDRPEISKALCTQCHFELTYPKRLTGKNVDCPSCSANFSLP